MDEFYPGLRCTLATETYSLVEGEWWCNCNPTTNTICWIEMGRQNAAAHKLGWDMAVQARWKDFLKSHRVIGIHHPVLQQPAAPIKEDEQMAAMAELARTAARQQEEQGHTNAAAVHENSSDNSPVDTPISTQFDRVADTDSEGTLNFDVVAPEDDLELWKTLFGSEQGAPTTLAAEITSQAHPNVKWGSR